MVKKNTFKKWAREAVNDIRAFDKRNRYWKTELFDEVVLAEAVAGNFQQAYEFGLTGKEPRQNEVKRIKNIFNDWARNIVSDIRTFDESEPQKKIDLYDKAVINVFAHNFQIAYNMGIEAAQ